MKSARSRIVDLKNAAASAGRGIFRRFADVAFAAERHDRTLERIAQSLERLEQRVDALAPAGEPEALRPSWHTAPEAGMPRHVAPASVVVPRSASYPPASLPPGTVPSTHGSLSDIPLSTLLAMFEFERRTGRLTCTDEGGEQLTFLLEEGKLVASRVEARVLSALDAVRRALSIQHGSFWFEAGAVEGAGEPESIGKLLIEATHRNDEAARTGTE